MEKQKLPFRQSRKPYWGVLAPDPEGKLFHKPDNFINLIQAQTQLTRTAPASASLKNSRLGGTQGRISGKHKSNHASKEIPL